MSDQPRQPSDDRPEAALGLSASMVPFLEHSDGAVYVHRFVGLHADRVPREQEDDQRGGARQKRKQEVRPVPPIRLGRGRVLRGNIAFALFGAHGFMPSIPIQMNDRS